MVTPGLFDKYPTVQQFAATRARGSGARHPLHGILPQQIEVGRGSSSQGCLGLRRQRAADDGGICDSFRESRARRQTSCWARWFKKNEGVVVRHARDAYFPSPGTDEARRCTEDRTGFVADYSTRSLDAVFSPGDLAREKAMVWRGVPKCAECGIEKLCHAADRLGPQSRFIRTQKRK